MGNAFRSAGSRSSFRRLSGEVIHLIVSDRINLVPPKEEGTLRLKNYNGYRACLFEVDFAKKYWRAAIHKFSEAVVKSPHRVIWRTGGVPAALGKKGVRAFLFQKVRTPLLKGEIVPGFTLLADNSRMGVKSNVLGEVHRISFELEESRLDSPIPSFAVGGTKCPECNSSRCDETCPSFS